MTPYNGVPSHCSSHLGTSFFPESADLTRISKIYSRLVPPFQRVGDNDLMARVIQSNPAVQLIPSPSTSAHHPRSSNRSGTHIDSSLLSGNPTLLSSKSRDIKSGRTVQTPLRIGRFTESLLPLVRYTVAKLKNLLAPGYYKISLSAAHGHFIWTLRPADCWSTLPMVAPLTGHFPGVQEAEDIPRYSNRLTSFVLSSCFPTEAVETRRGLTRILNPEIARSLQVVTITSFDLFICV
jgi:hypothetical protein